MPRGTEHHLLNTTYWNVVTTTTLLKLGDLYGQNSRVFGVDVDHFYRPRLIGDTGSEVRNVYNDELFADRNFVNQSQTGYTPPSDIQTPRRCVPAIDSCPKTWRDVEVSTQCRRENNTRYVKGKLFGAKQTFRNWHCAVCNGLPVGEIVCDSGYSCCNIDQDPNLDYFSLSILLDLNTGKGNVVGHRSRQGAEERLVECSQFSVYDPYAAVCRPFSCPPGQSFNDVGDCSDVINRPEIKSSVVEISADNDHADSPSVRLPNRNQSDSSVGGKVGSVGFDQNQPCLLIALNSSEYRKYDSGSVYVPLYNITYETGEYRVDADAVLYVCSPFTGRNYTKRIFESSPTLLLKAVNSYLSLVCSAVSLAALAFQLIVYMSFPVLRNRPGKLIICLVVTLFVGQLLFVLVHVAARAGYVYCFGHSVVMHYSYLAAFCWMNVMSIDVCHTFTSSAALTTSTPQAASGKKRFAVYSVYAWGSSGFVVLTSSLMDVLEVGGVYRPEYGLYGLCWFGSREGLLVFFALPLGVVLVVNVGLFVATVVQIHRTSKATRVAVQKPANFTLIMIYAKLSVVMGLGWLLGFLSAYIDSEILSLLFILVNSLQGAFICAAFVLTRQVLRLIHERVGACLNPTPPGQHLTNSSSSKPLSASSPNKSKTLKTGSTAVPV